MSKILTLNDYYNKEVEYIITQHGILSMVSEQNNYVPRFSLKDIEIFKDIPVNQPLKYSDDIIIKAIKYGLIFLINYKGAKDKNFAGHERVIYPLVLGRSSKGNPLLRGYHLSGWSVSQNNHVKKVWRLFRTDRVLSLTFTGSFFRLAPDGYNMDDRGMRGGIIANADFDEIRKNQEKLLNKQKIQDREDVSLGKEKEKGTTTIEVENTNTQLDLNSFMENDIVKEVDDLDNLRVSFLKSVFGGNHIAILGALGAPGNKVKVLQKDPFKNLGTFKVIDSAIGKNLKNIKNVKGNSTYDLYIFLNKKGS